MVKVIWLLLLTLFTSSAFAQTQEFSRPAQDRVMIGSDLIVREDEHVKDVIVIAGNANILGTVEGEITVIGGSLTLDGLVQRDVTVVLGNAVIGEDAEIGGEATLIGGPFVVHPNASIMRQVRQFSLGDFVPKVEWFKAWVTQGFIMGRPIAPSVTWTWYAAAIFLGIYLLVSIAFPQPIHASMEAVYKNPVTSLMTGLLSLFLLGPLVLLLIISVVGILTIPFLVCGLFLVFMFGKSTIFGLVGKSLTSALGAKRFPLPLAVLLGGIILGVTYMVPILGILMWGASAIVGFGAVILAISQSFKNEAAKMPPVPVQVGGADPAKVASVSPALALAPAVGPTSSAVATPDVLLLQRAGFWRRLAAGILDTILLSFTAPIIHAALPLAFLIYVVCMWTFWGSTVGGMILGLKVVRLDGRPVNLAVSLVRALSSIFSAIVFFLGFLWVAWDKEKQGWHDKIAGTTVVRLPKGRFVL